VLPGVVVAVWRAVVLGTVAVAVAMVVGVAASVDVAVAIRHAVGGNSVVVTVGGRWMAWMGLRRCCRRCAVGRTAV
jgi:hypothetical protein